MNDTPFSETIEHVRVDYFRWLCDRVNIGDHQGRSYYILARLMHNREFYSAVERDQNRIGDVRTMRRNWLEDYDKANGSGTTPLDALDTYVSFFELVVSLCIRMERDILWNDDFGDRVSVWFWHMMKNCGLEKFSDDGYDFTYPEKVSQILDTILDRTYDKDGTGGLFPLQFSKADQRKVELWYQLTAWINEKNLVFES